MTEPITEVLPPICDDINQPPAPIACPAPAQAILVVSWAFSEQEVKKIFDTGFAQLGNTWNKRTFKDTPPECSWPVIIPNIDIWWGTGTISLPSVRFFASLAGLGVPGWRLNLKITQQTFQVREWEATKLTGNGPYGEYISSKTESIGGIPIVPANFIIGT